MKFIVKAAVVACVIAHTQALTEAPKAPLDDPTPSQDTHPAPSCEGFSGFRASCGMSAQGGHCVNGKTAEQCAASCRQISSCKAFDHAGTECCVWTQDHTVMHSTPGINTYFALEAATAVPASSEEAAAPTPARARAHDGTPCSLHSECRSNICSGFGASSPGGKCCVSNCDPDTCGSVSCSPSADPECPHVEGWVAICNKAQAGGQCTTKKDPASCAAWARLFSADAFDFTHAAARNCCRWDSVPPSLKSNEGAVTYVFNPINHVAHSSTATDAPHTPADSCPPAVPIYSRQCGMAATGGRCSHQPDVQTCRYQCTFGSDCSAFDFDARATTLSNCCLWEYVPTGLVSTSPSVATYILDGAKPTRGANDGKCDNSCQYANDGVCDDGGAGSVTSTCDLGTDTADCGFDADLCVPAQLYCDDSCSYANDGMCDDKSTSSGTTLCPIGTDYSDCNNIGCSASSYRHHHRYGRWVGSWIGGSIGVFVVCLILISVCRRRRYRRRALLRASLASQAARPSAPPAQPLLHPSSQAPVPPGGFSHSVAQSVELPVARPSDPRGPPPAYQPVAPNAPPAYRAPPATVAQGPPPPVYRAPGAALPPSAPAWSPSRNVGPDPGQQGSVTYSTPTTFG